MFKKDRSIQTGFYAIKGFPNNENHKQSVFLRRFAGLSKLIGCSKMFSQSERLKRTSLPKEYAEKYLIGSDPGENNRLKFYNKNSSFVKNGQLFKSNTS